MVTSGKDLEENTTVIQADQFPIKAVKLFSSGSAEVTRTFPLSKFLRSKAPTLTVHCSTSDPWLTLLQDESQVVEIVHLPANIQAVHVSVTSGAPGNVTIIDHFHVSVANSTPSSETLRELGTEQLQLENEKRLRQQKAAQMVAFFDQFVEIGVTRSTVIAELDGKLADVANRISAETGRLSKLSKNLPVKLVTVLACNGQTSLEGTELTVTYVVKQVSWKPSYDLHIAMTGNTPSPTVKLDFRCTVTQWTGENWENVSLALTTAAQVSQLIKLPEPKRIDISLGRTSAFSPPGAFGAPQLFGQPGVFNQPRQAIGAGVARHDHEAATRAHAAFSAPAAPPPPPPPTSSVQAQIPEVEVPSQTVSQLISHDSKDPITHIASGNIFIPSDNTEHHVLVASVSLQADFMRVVVPSVDTRVYYTCEVKNRSEYVLLPGIVKTYLNDKHVSSTEIHNTELPQILECSLAVDTGVKALHNRAPDALPSVASFTGKATTTYTSATVLHNTHGEAIRGVIVRNAIPLPTDPRITIVLKEPAGLAGIDEGTVTVKEGCLARWSTTGGRKGKEAGLFEWVCDMIPGTEVLKAVWEVCAPQDLKLVEQACP